MGVVVELPCVGLGETVDASRSGLLAEVESVATLALLLKYYVVWCVVVVRVGSDRLVLFRRLISSCQ